MEGAEAVVGAKANEQGVLFGSVSAREIALNLREQGYEVADEIVQLKEHIKNIGTHSVELRFTEDLKVAVNVVVVALGEGGSEVASAAEETSSQESEQEKSE